MKTIHRFVLSPDEQAISMPKGAKVLSVGTKERFPTAMTPYPDPEICIWALVDDSSEMETRQFSVFGTGHQIPEFRLDSDRIFDFIGTVKYVTGNNPINPILFFHVFEVGTKIKWSTP